MESFRCILKASINFFLWDYLFLLALSGIVSLFGGLLVLLIGLVYYWIPALLHLIFAWTLYYTGLSKDFIEEPSQIFIFDVINIALYAFCMWQLFVEGKMLALILIALFMPIVFTTIYFVIRKRI